MSEDDTIRGKEPVQGTYAAPPVTEVYIDVKFKPSADKTTWDRNVIRPLVDQFGVEFPKSKEARRLTLQIKHGQADHAPSIDQYEEIFERIQLFSSDSVHCVQIGEDRLVCNLRKVGDIVPHYCDLVPHFESALETYTSYMQPGGVESQALGYVDLVNIPDASFEPADYFQLLLIAPSRFPDMTSMNFRCDFQLDDRRTLHVEWIDVTAEHTPRFQIHWTLTATDGVEVDKAALVRNADDLHDRLTGFFEQAITDKCRELFRQGE